MITPYRKTYFISDLHLDEQAIETIENFLDFLSHCDQLTDSIYILGDLFEVWIGDDDDSPFHQKIVNGLKKTVDRGIPIFFMHGNRDFLIGKNFLKKTGCKQLSDEEKISLYETDILLMHGDTLCIHDVRYLKVRKRVRNRFVQGFILLFPLSWRRYVANKIRIKSKKNTKHMNRETMDVVQSEVERVMERYDVKHLIHGHTHRPATHEFFLQDIPAKRFVLGAWHKTGMILVWDETGKIELMDSKDVLTSQKNERMR